MNTNPRVACHRRASPSNRASHLLPAMTTYDLRLCPHRTPHLATSLTLSSPSTLLAAISLAHRRRQPRRPLGLVVNQGFSVSTHSPPCQLPRPLIDPACTLVMRRRFSVSDRLADSCASCECRCVCGPSSAAEGKRGSGSVMPHQLSRLDDAAARRRHALPVQVLRHVYVSRRHG